MNRQIKFRGRCADGEWAVGIPITTHIGTFIATEENPHVCDLYGYIEIDLFAKVDPSSIGQYTGLKDCNGVEVYEGDIFTVKGKYPRVVLWDKVSWALMPVEHYHDKYFWEMNLQHPDNEWWEYFAEEIEVIGNIHDNKIK